MTACIELEPLVKRLTLTCSVEHAFAVYTERIADWWPTKDYSINGDDTVGVFVEPGKGGRIFETNPSGEEFEWGVITVWEPPLRLAHSWHPGSKETTYVDITFSRIPTGCELRLVHSGWAATDLGARSRSGYVSGWDDVLRLFGRHAVGE